LFICFISLHAAADVVAAADVDDNDDEENPRDDASDLELVRREVHEVLTQKNPNNSFLTQLNYFIIISIIEYIK